MTTRSAILRTAIGLDDVSDGLPAQGTGRLILLELEGARVAQTQVATVVQRRVRRVVAANGAVVQDLRRAGEAGRTGGDRAGRRGVLLHF